MTAADIRFGMGGGRRLDAGAALPADIPKPVLAICPHRDLHWVPPSYLGTVSCCRDGKPMRLATEAEAAAAGLTLDFDNPRPA